MRYENDKRYEHVRLDHALARIHSHIDESGRRVDAAESVFFLRQLESIDQQAYQVLYPELLSRTLIPTQNGVPDWAAAYTWRMYDKFGKATVIRDHSTALPRVDAKGEEKTQNIHEVGAAYGYTTNEIRAAAATNTPLESMRAAAARYEIEVLIDEYLAIGNTALGLTGLLSIASGTTSLTAGAKSGGGKTWAKATPREMLKDILDNGAVKMAAATKNAFSKFDVVLPIDQYNMIDSTPMGEGIAGSVLDKALGSKLIASITPWYRCSGQGSQSTDRMCFYPKNPMVLAGLVPKEFTPEPPEKKNREYVIDCTGATGGTIIRYPVAVGYLDGI